MVRSLYLALACAAALAFSSVPQAADYTKPKVRAITAFVRLNPATYENQISDAQTVLRMARSQFAKEGYETETAHRISRRLSWYRTVGGARAHLKNLDGWGWRISYPTSVRR
jgi:hypothetical protein